MKTETPMIRQYREIKEHNQDKILLFRVGDFYEMFYEDAKIGSRELEITLTSRETGKDNHVPLAGFPYHALNNYLGRLIERGYKVAICEQVEDPKLAKGIVKREIVRVITPGTVTEASLLDEKSNNYLVSVYIGRGGCGLAALDVSTGEFFMSQERGKAADKFLADELCRLRPAEVLVNEGARDEGMFVNALRKLDSRVTVNPLRDRLFALKQSTEALLSHFKVAGTDSLGCTGMLYALPAAGAALLYLRDNRQGSLAHLHRPEIYDFRGYMVLDAATRRNLELTRTIREERKYGSLLWVLDKTRSALGGRMLKRWLEQPLLDRQLIEARLDAVQELTADYALLEDLSLLLDEVYDLERLLGRIHCETANARDLIALRNTLAVLPRCREMLQCGGRPMQELGRRIPALTELTSYLVTALAEDPPLTLREGGLIRDGFHSEVDQLRHTCRHGRDIILAIEQRERERSGIKSLKVGYNKVFGYYIEITRANAHLTPDDYIRKQTLANAERYITPELKEYEPAVLGAEEKICALEYEIFLQVRDVAAGYTEAVQEGAAVLAELDVYQALARTARENRYIRPVLEEGTVVEISDGRHPVVEQVMQDEMFVPNDTVMDTESRRLLMITGPNMAGKSTYMRQTALIVLMAQMGSFVPAKAARIGMADRIFTRIGAADDLVGGHSTFMVEMSEVANILARATDRSLVLLDEVGRGTSTYDGISIARAVAEYLYSRVKARTLFATHYHELADLSAQFPAMANLATAVKEKGEDIVFLHKVIPGSADHSYGIQVARLAGLPGSVIARSRAILESLKAPAEINAQAAAAVEEEQLRLFVPDPALAAAMDEVEGVDFMTTTPLEAMQLLHRLQQAIRKGNSHG
jgi:DNA mismatch repair protein MutS